MKNWISRASGRPPSWPSAVSAAAILFGSASIGAAAPAADQHWPQWRGPLATGVAPAANPPTTWSESNHIKWKVKIPGTGHATPIIWENQVFIQTAKPAGSGSKSEAEEKSGAA